MLGLFRSSLQLGVTSLSVALVASSCAGTPSTNTTAGVQNTPPTEAASGLEQESQCIGLPSGASADSLLANTYALSPHPAVQLPSDPDWSENPLGDNNWMFQYHSLRYAYPLLVRWQETGDPDYLERFGFLLEDWHRDNPRIDPPSLFSWNDHSTAQRAMVLACASEFIDEPWVDEALALHGETLADPEFYVGRGNHAFNQALGLLAVACRLGHQSWIDLASERVDGLLLSSLDEQGVTNEQAVEYQVYNRKIYAAASDRFTACRQPELPSFERIKEMTDFLSHATMPNGEYVMLGDTGRRDADGDPSLETEFTASGGTSGNRPDSVSALYDTGFFFSRSGWGDDRAFADEVFLSVRFGPGRTFHGHEDGGSVTLYGYGSPLLIDSGKFTYNDDQWRDYFVGPSAHNGVLVDGVPYVERQPTDLKRVHRADEYDYLLLERPLSEDATWSREVLFARAGYVVIIDRIPQSDAKPVHQLWHLVEDADPEVDGNAVVTQRAGGNVAIIQLAETESISIVEGSERPVQGWISYDFGVREAAPTVVATSTGTDVVFVTLLAPSPDTGVPEIRAFALNDDGIDLDLVYRGRRDVVKIDGASVELETDI